MKLWYEQPAEHWLEALPVGNGSLGAMVYGGAHSERIALNEETLWSGHPRETDNPKAAGHLEEARRLALAGKYAQSHKLINEKMLSHTNTESYMPLGDLFLTYNEFSSEFCGYENYNRTLDLEKAAAVTEFTSTSGIKIKRVIIASHPAGCLLISINSSEPLGLTASFSSQLKHGVECRENDLVLSGRAPDHVEPNYRPERSGVSYNEGRGMTFESRLRVLSHDGGGMEEAGGSLTVYGAKNVLLAVACATSFGGYDVMPAGSGIDPAEINRAVLDRNRGRSWDELEKEHREDYQSLYGRVEIDLGMSSRDALPTDKRLAQLVEASEDPSLVSLLYQYGRYLLISSSRERSASRAIAGIKPDQGHPANLQGLWNKEVRAPWSSNMTMNINAQMNYWPAETSALGECHQPFFHMLEELKEQGAKTAIKHFGARGALCAHNTDIWRFTSPVRGNATFAQWPFGLAWSCGHIWEHYAFTLDREFLARMLPVLKDAARFMLDYLVEDLQTGQLTTAPSTSPENSFYDPGTGKSCSVCTGSTMDLAIMEELFDNALKALELLGDEDGLGKEIRAALKKLARPGIGAKGQLLEFNGEFEEEDPHHRHVSHLYGVYPGSLYTNTREKEYFVAAMKSLDIRGDLSTGWAMAWRIALWARFGKGDRSLGVIKNFLKLISPNERVRGADYSTGGGIYTNMFCAHPPFQIDGNFGAVAGITEMFLQSHQDELRLLPALPEAFPTGRISGIKARGNISVSLEWAENELVRAELTSPAGGEVRVRYKGSFVDVFLEAGKPLPLERREWA